MHYLKSQGPAPAMPEEIASPGRRRCGEGPPARLGAIVQARMSSSRLPGKVLRPLAGKAMLAYLLERLDRLEALDMVVVATSEGPEDDPVAEFCRANGVPCHRGPLDDVARRLLDCAAAHALEAFVRVCGDSPLLDLELLRQGVAAYWRHRPDVVTNCLPKTFPPGQSVEIVRTQALELAYGRFGKQEQHEHVTAYFYEHQEAFSVCRLPAGSGYAGVHLAVDLPRDMERLAAMIDRMEKPHWAYGVDDLARLYAAAGGDRTGEGR